MKPQTTIYYVDDDEDDLTVFSEAIAGFGHKPSLFLDGYDMLLHLENSDPKSDIVFVDLNMPTISGYDVISAIRKSEKFSNVPIISYSTANDSMSISLAQQAGANFHLPKSNTYEGLKQSLGYVLNIDWANYQPGDEGFVYAQP